MTCDPRFIKKLPLICTVILLVAAEARPAPTDREVAAVAKAELLGARVNRNSDGKVESVFFFEKRIINSLTDDDMETVDFAAFTELTNVYLVAKNITDRSLIHLSIDRPQLAEFHLVGTKISDNGLAQFLAKQKSLYSLSIDQVPITDGTLPAIGKLDRLRMLSLRSTRISDKGAKELSRLENLYYLELSHTDISDAGLVEIAKLTNLSGLFLRGTKVTDVGIQRLGVLRSLATLGISSTSVTEEGKRSLQKRLPKLKFVK